MNLRQRCLFDVDGVIGDFTGLYLHLASQVTGRSYVHDDVDQWSIWKAIGLTDREKRLVEEELKKPGSALRIEELPGAVEAVKQVAEIADVYFVTSPWDSCPTWSHDRREWLMLRFGELGKKVVHTTCKEVVVGDLLVDDKPDNLIEWSKDPRNGVPVLWSHPSNRSFGEQGLIRRLSSWDDVLRIVRFES